MPKQRKYDFKRLQGRSNDHAKADNGNKTTISVNDRLSELRIANPTVAAQIKRDIAANVNQPSVPPALRSILGVPESASPRARPGSRVPYRCRVPGPAPPTSWLRGDTTGSRSMSKEAEHITKRTRPEAFRFRRLCDLSDVLDTRTLSHQCMKQLAIHWHLLEDYQTLLVLPLRTRSLLISYLGVYGPTISIDALRVLVSGNDYITTLDLAGLIGHDTLTIPGLAKEIKATQKKRSSQVVPIADSWDQETYLPASLDCADFSRLTYLCLSHPPPTVTWNDLLSLTKLTPAVTHLSLADWQQPALEQDMTHTGDDDLDQPRALLRQLSNNLLRLQWLDIEGNPHWIYGLAGCAYDITGPYIPTHVANELTTTWRNLNYIRCAQSWQPDCICQEQHIGQNILPSIDESKYHLWWMTHVNAHKNNAASIPKYRTWHDVEETTILAAGKINWFRRSNNCSLISFDLGWN